MHTAQRRAPELSVVIPLYDEEPGVDLLVARLRSVLETLPESWEVILVDDGSSDRTWRRVEEVHRRDPRFRGLSLWRNFGHQGALFAGLSHARGRAVVTMDGDLQHPPEVIPELVARWRAGARIVATRRLDSEDTSAFKRWTSRAFYRVFSALSRLEMAPGTSDFRLLDRRAVDVLLEMGESELFLRGMVQWMGGPTEVVTFRAHDRARGEAKFSPARMVRLSTAGLVSFSSVPLEAGIWLGLATGGLALAEIVYIFVQYFRGETVPGWASAMALTSFMFAVLFVLMGILGTYVASLHATLKRRPRFLVGEAVGYDARARRADEEPRGARTELTLVRSR